MIYVQTRTIDKISLRISYRGDTLFHSSIQCRCPGTIHLASQVWDPCMMSCHTKGTYQLQPAYMTIFKKDFAHVQITFAHVSVFCHY